MAEDLERYNSSLTGAEVDVALQDMAQRISERYAKGTANGVPVTSGQVGYQDNSKFYAQKAKEDADRAQSAVPIGTESAVLWTMAQSLTDSAKQVARTNIGAGNPLGTVAGGKNLFNYDDVKVQTIYGITNRASIYWDVVGTYTFKHSGSNVQNISYRLWDKSTNAWKSGSSTLGIGRGFTVTMSANDVLVLWGASDVTVPSFISSIPNAQLEEGNTATPYEPYYSSNLALTRKQNIVNLLNVTASTQTIQGITYTVNKDGTITANGTATAMSQLIIGRYNFVSGVNYRLVGGFSNNRRIYAQIGDSVWKDDVGKGVNFTGLDSGNRPIGIAIEQGTVCNNLIFKPMITTNLDATYEDFIEYGHYEQKANEWLTNTKYYSGLIYDFNNMNDGIHFCAMQTGKVANAPTTADGMLIQVGDTNRLNISQLYVARTDGATYTRGMRNGTWGSWRTIS